MDKLIFSIAIGMDPAYVYGIKSISNYAKRVNADFLLVNKPVYQEFKTIKKLESQYVACLQKMYCKELLKQYSRVLYLDSDIIVSPQARDIFQHCPDETAVYIFNEGQLDSLDRTKTVQEIIKTYALDKTWPEYNGKPFYGNAGVMLFSSKSLPLGNATLEGCLWWANQGLSYFEQSYLNYVFVRDGVKLIPLESRFNYTSASGPPEDRFSQDFIHYAGYSFRTKKTRRYKIMRKDFYTLYPGSRLERTSRIWIDGSKQLYWSLYKKLFKLRRRLRGSTHTST